MASRSLATMTGCHIWLVCWRFSSFYSNGCIRNNGFAITYARAYVLPVRPHTTLASTPALSICHTFIIVSHGLLFSTFLCLYTHTLSLSGAWNDDLYGLFKVNGASSETVSSVAALCPSSHTQASCRSVPYLAWACRFLRVSVDECWKVPVSWLHPRGRNWMRQNLNLRRCVRIFLPIAMNWENVQAINIFLQAMNLYFAYIYE